MSFAISNGCRIYYRLEGENHKPLLVLVHALGTDHGLWDPQVPALTRYFQVLRLDLRGHGASDSTAGDYTIEQLAGDVLTVIDAAGSDSFHYCGLSLGGMIGMWLGAHSRRLNNLILANTSSKMADPSIFETRRKSVLEQGMRSIEESVMARYFRSSTTGTDSVRNTLRTCDPVGYAGCCAAIRDMDHRRLLAQITAPTLIISGTDDISTPWPGHGEVLAQSISGARAVHLNAAHLSNRERPAGFITAVLEFLLPITSGDPIEDGFAIRRAVLGDAHVDRSMASATDFNREFQQMITRYAWGTIWSRPGLDPRTRRLLVLAITASMGRWEEFRLHTRSGLENDLEIEELKELLLQTAIYAGVPAANTGFQIAAELINTTK